MALPYPNPPLFSRYASKALQRQEKFDKNADSSGVSCSHPDNIVKLDEPGGLESKNSHALQNRSWKSKFKPGDEFVLHGMTFVFHSTSKRNLQLRPKR